MSQRRPPLATREVFRTWKRDDFDVFKFHDSKPRPWETELCSLYVLFIYFSAFLLVPSLLMYTLLYTSGYTWIAFATIIGLYFLVTYDSSEWRTGRRWAEFSEDCAANTALRRYFKLEVYVPKELGVPDGGSAAIKCPCVVAMHPHGLLSDWRVLIDGILPTILPVNHKGFRTLAASSLFYIPVARELALWTGCINARNDIASSCLQKGYSVLVVPGGQREMEVTREGQERVVLTKRRGFIRLAVANHFPIVPAYVFGANDCYRTLSIEPEWLSNFRESFRKMTGIAIPLGVGDFPYFWMPRKVPLRIVFGHPIYPTGSVNGPPAPPASPNSNSEASTSDGTSPSGSNSRHGQPVGSDQSAQPIDTVDEKEVEALHRQYCDSLRSLFDCTKEFFPEYRNRSIEFTN